MEVRIMVVPGRIARVSLEQVTVVTVLDACAAAAVQIPTVDWSGLAKDREVRVQNRKFSNTEEIPEGYTGSIFLTPLNEGDVVLILTKIKGNAVGEGALTCQINGEEYALETPVEASKVLAEVVGIDLNMVVNILINDESAELSQLVGDGDKVQVFFKEEKSEHDEGEEEEYSSSQTPAQVPPAGEDEGNNLIQSLKNYIQGLKDKVMTTQVAIQAAVGRSLPQVFRQVIYGYHDEKLSVAKFKDGDTIETFLGEHDLRLEEGEVILRNGEPVDDNDLETDLEDGDSLVIVLRTVIFGRLGGKLKQVAFEEGDSLCDLLNREGVELEEEVILYNGIMKDPDEDDFGGIFLNERDSVMVVPVIKIGTEIIFPTQK